jgi:hypothetical protein
LLVRGMVVVMVLYLGVVAFNGPRKTLEIFPFFNWELFSRVPQAQRDDFNVRLVKVNGERLAQPLYFDHASKYLSLSWSPDAYILMQTIGKQTEAGQAFQAASARAIFETRFLGDLHTATYQLVRHHFKILDRVKCDCFVSEVVLGTYQLR